MSNENMNNELQNKAILAETVLNNSISNSTADKQIIQTEILKTQNSNQDIKEITILSPVTNGFNVIASTNQQNLGLTFTSREYIKAWSTENPITTLTNDTTKNPAERSWSVLAPVKNEITGQKTFLVDFKISLTSIDAATQKNQKTSLIALVIITFLVLLLLVNFFRFFQYAILYKKLDEVDKMKDDFISIASHEMKTPMAAIKGYISMMMEGLVGNFDEKTKEHLIKINSNVERLDLLLSETLDVSRLEQGRMQFDMQPYNISQIIAQSITAVQDQADSKKLRLTEQKLDQMPQIFIDPDRLRQVVDNLVNNAIKYTQKGSVTISYKMINGNLQTIIKDTGIGMNSQDKKNLFNKFYRIKNEKTVDIPGTGLGLWIAREIIRKMNGDILVNSTENVGSEFIIQLPYIKEK